MRIESAGARGDGIWIEVSLRWRISDARKAAGDAPDPGK